MQKEPEKEVGSKEIWLFPGCAAWLGMWDGDTCVGQPGWFLGLGDFHPAL